MIKILLTRSAENNLEMAAALKKYGYECFLCPMLHIEPLAINFDSYDHFRDVIITSNVAAKILVANINYAINVWVVGKKAADVLAENKNIKIIFKNINH